MKAFAYCCVIGLVVSFATSAFSAKSTDTAETRLELKYEVRWKFLRLLEFTSRTEMDGQGPYRMETDSETVGAVGTFFPWKARAEAGGRIHDGRLVPQAYHTWSRFRGNLQQVDVAWRDGVPRVNVVGETLEDGHREPVPAELQKNTIDPLTALAALSLNLARTGRCEGRWPVFDGLRRYDMTFVDLGEVELEESSRDPWTGKARYCETKFDLLGGGWESDEPREEEATRLTAWLKSPIAGSDPVPVRFRAESDAGALDIHLLSASFLPTSTDSSGTSDAR